MPDHNEISLDSVTKMFEFEKHARQIDECNDINELKSMLKASMKLFLKQQEVVSKLGLKGV
jgi:hypothetical protein|tara:strand:+ start:13131 stop:13313 length:183 start_codon:yes stop_codon:yes gene_type:complete